MNISDISSNCCNPECQDIVINIGDQQITGKDAVVRSLNIITSCENMLNCYSRETEHFKHTLEPRPVEIEISLLVFPDKFNMKFWDNGYSPKIRDKNVSKCSIQELLFAIRQKINKKTE